MIKYYGKVGESAFGVDSVGIASAWDGWMEMHTSKPEFGDWYAGENGEWMSGKSPVEEKARVNTAKAQKMRLMAEADAMIRAIEAETLANPSLYVIPTYNEYTDEIEEVNAELEAWYSYKKDLIRVDVNAENIVWPELP